MFFTLYLGCLFYLRFINVLFVFYLCFIYVLCTFCVRVLYVFGTLSSRFPRTLLSRFPARAPQHGKPPKNSHSFCLKLIYPIYLVKFEALECHSALRHSTATRGAAWRCALRAALPVALCGTPRRRGAAWCSADRTSAKADVTVPTTCRQVVGSASEGWYLNI